MEIKYNVYEIWPEIHCYHGRALVAAENADEANKIIEEFKKSDRDNLMDSRGYSTVDEDDRVQDLFSCRKGIITYGIRYGG